MTPVINDHVLTEDGKWLGSTPDNHVMIKFTTQLPLPMFSKGSHYMLLNLMEKALALLSEIDPGHDLYLYDLPAYPQVGCQDPLFVCITTGHLVNYLISVGCIVFPHDPK